jgi:pimeloyl-ACP methyl ester carboxylesterase
VGLRRIELPDGRVLALDDVGDPDGVPIVYLHGLPDSRLARHPDDSLAERAGVRLLAVDRPGAGDSSPDPAATLTSLGDDLAVALDALGVGGVALLGWSSGGLAALGAATLLGARARALGLVATVPPAEAYGDAAVVAALGPTRRPLVEMAADASPAEVAAEVAPYLVPQPLTWDLALEHVLEGAGEVGRRELAGVPGAAEALAAGLVAGVAAGTGALEQDLRLQLTPGLDLSAVQARVLLYHGGQDGVSPPEVGAWLAARLPGAVVEVLPEAGHHLLFALWPGLLRGLGRLAGG